jgi:hypothetical protein
MTSPPVTDPFASMPEAAEDPFASLSDPTQTATSAPKPLDRTAGNYGREVAAGVGRGLMDDVGGVVSTLLHPINTATGLVKQTQTAMQAETQRSEELKSAYPDSGGWKNKLTRMAAGELAGLENAPIVGGMVQRAEQGGTRVGSPEAVGAAAEGITAFGAPELAGKAAGAAARSDYVTEATPRHLINHLIKPQAADVKFGKNPAMAISKEGIVGNSLSQLGDRTYAKVNEVGKQLDAQARLPSNAAKVLDVSGSLKPIDDAMAKAAKDGNLKLYRSLTSLQKQLTSDYRQFRDPQGNLSLRRWGPKQMKMSPEAALAFKRTVADQIRWNGNDPFNDDLNGVKGEIYGSLKDEVNRAVPGLKELNERYSNLVGAAKAIERRTPVAERNAQWSLSDIALGATGHIPTAIARKVMGAPGVTTRVARALDRVGKSGVPKPVRAAGAGVQAGVYAGMTQHEKDLQAIRDKYAAAQ